MTAYLAQAFNTQFFDGATVAAGYSLYTYDSGTVTPKTVYKNQAGTVAHTNPIVLDADGMPPGGTIWITSGEVTFVLKDLLGATVWTRDDIGGASSFGDFAAQRCIDTVAEIRGLDKTLYSKAFVFGYYAPGDGGGGEYWLDSNDTTSSDNGGTIIVATDGGRWKLSHRGQVSVKQFGAIGIDGTTDDHPYIQAAFDNVDSVWVPKGIYGLSDSLSITRTNMTIDGECWVGTMFCPLAASTTLGAANSIIRVDVQPLNGAIRNIRFKTLGSYTGWAIVAGTSTTGKNLFSTELANIWCDFSSTASGFFKGGLYDCFVHHCQFENLQYRFLLEGVSSCGNRTIITQCNDIGGRLPFIETPALSNTGFIISDISVATIVGQSVLASRNYWIRARSSQGWVVSNIRLDAGSTFDPATSYCGFASFTDCVNMSINGVIARIDDFGLSDFLGLRINNSEVFADGVRIVDNSTARNITPILLEGATINVKLTDFDVVGGTSDQIRFNSSGIAGRFELSDCSFKNSKARIISDAYGDHSLDFYAKGNRFINPFYGAASASTNYIFLFGTSGQTEFIGNTIGRDAAGESGGLSAPGAIFRLIGSGVGKIESNTLQRLGPELWNYSSVTQRIASSISRGNSSLADDGVLYLPNATSGVAHVQCGDEAATFVFGSTAGSVTKVAGTANTIASDTDGNLCAFWSSANTLPTIRNRLGAANRISVRYEFT